MSDDWYIDAVGHMDTMQRNRHDALSAEGTETLIQAGMGDVAQAYDAGLMQAAGVPMDGTVSPRFAEPGTQMAGHFDAATGQNMAPVTASAPSFPDDMATQYGQMLTDVYGRIGQAGRTPEEAIRTGISALYDFGAGIWNFSADVTEWLTEQPGHRVQSAENKGLSPRGPVNKIVADVLPFVMGFSAASKRLATLVGQPRSFFTRATQPMAAGAGADMVLADPREDSLLDLMLEFGWLQDAALQHVNPAELYETAGPMAGRLGMAAEGVAVGSLVGGLMGARKQLPGAAVALGMALWGRADAVEGQAVQALTRSRGHVREGLDETDAGWLTVWLGAKIMKGEKRLTPALAEQAAPWHVTTGQLEAAWNRAARIAQEASKQVFRKATEGRLDGG